MTPTDSEPREISPSERRFIATLLLCLGYLWVAVSWGTQLMTGQLGLDGLMFTGLATISLGTFVWLQT